MGNWNNKLSLGTRLKKLMKLRLHVARVTKFTRWHLGRLAMSLLSLLIGSNMSFIILKKMSINYAVH